MGFTPKFVELFDSLKTFKDKPEGQKHFYAELQKFSQLERCLNLYRIEDKNTGIYKFFGGRISKEQREFIENQSGRDLILKPRQIGMTGLQIILGLDEAIFSKGARCGIMAHTKDKALSSIFERVRKTWEWFQKDWGVYIPITCATDNANSLTFAENNSSIIVGFDFRSNKLNRLHISESAFIRDDERITASQQAVPPPPFGKISHETTPRGRAGYFFDNWMSSGKAAAKGDPVVWKQHFYKWWDHYPEGNTRYDLPQKPDWEDRENELMSVYNVSIQSLLWRRWKIQESYQNDPEKFEVDYPTDDRDCFIGGYGILSRTLLMKLEKKLREPIFRGELIEQGGLIRAVEKDDGPIYMWERPKSGIEYCMGVDTSEGRGGNHDYSVAVLKNRSTHRQAAMIYTNTRTPAEMAEMVYMLGKFYNSAWICPERNTCGGELTRQLDTMNYGYIYSAKADNVDRVNDSNQLGFYTSVMSKEQIVLQFVSRIRAGFIIPSSNKWFDEMTNFGRDDKGRLQALAGHDDIFIAGCLCEEMDKTLGDFEEVDSSYEHNSFSIDPLTGFAS